MASQTTTQTLGKARRRNEDPRLLTGQALFTDDVHLEGLVHAAFLRSPYAHARLRRVDAARARAVKLAESHGCRFAAPPRGLFGWVDVGVDTERLARVMLDDGWLLAPGALFHATHRPTTLMRINFATTQDARFWRALAEARPGL